MSTGVSSPPNAPWTSEGTTGPSGSPAGMVMMAMLETPRVLTGGPRARTGRPLIRRTSPTTTSCRDPCPSPRTEGAEVPLDRDEPRGSIGDARCSTNTIMSMLVMLLLVGFFIAVPVIAGVIRGRRSPRMTTTSCRHCGYDLRRLRKGTACPECGTAVGLTGPGRAVDPDRPSCRGCGHLLANLPWNATCPECGLASAAMPRFQRPRRRDWFTPGRILQFVLGSAWLLVGIFLMITALAFVFGGLR